MPTKTRTQPTKAAGPISFSGIGSEIAALCMEHAFDDLDAPVLRVCAADVPLRQRFAQARVQRGVVEVDPQQVDARDDLAADRKQRARNRDDEPADRPREQQRQLQAGPAPEESGYCCQTEGVSP